MSVTITVKNNSIYSDAQVKTAMDKQVANANRALMQHPCCIELVAKVSVTKGKYKPLNHINAVSDAIAKLGPSTAGSVNVGVHPFGGTQTGTGGTTQTAPGSTGQGSMVINQNVLLGGAAGMGDLPVLGHELMHSLVDASESDLKDNLMGTTETGGSLGYGVSAAQCAAWRAKLGGGKK